MENILGLNGKITNPVSIQDRLILSYTLASEQELALTIGKVGDQVENLHSALKALNKLNAIATYPLTVSTGPAGYKAKICIFEYRVSFVAAQGVDVKSYFDNPTLAYMTDLINVRDQFMEGYTALSLLKQNNLLGDADSLVAEVLTQAFDAKKAISALGPSGEIPTSGEIRDNLAVALGNWFNGAGGTEYNPMIKKWSVQTNLINAINSFEYVQSSLEDQLRESMLLYQQFSNSAGAALKKLNKLYRSISRGIG